MLPDPAVQYANQIRKGAIAYREGYVGDGYNRLHYVEAGNGPLIIFYHGFPSFWYCWFNQMEVLKTQYRVIAIDGLGAGLSAKPDTSDAYKVKNLAAQLDEFARHINGRKRFILIGQLVLCGMHHEALDLDKCGVPHRPGARVPLDHHGLIDEQAKHDVGVMRQLRTHRADHVEHHPGSRSTGDRCDDPDDDPDGEPTVACPYCRRDIYEDAVRCPYCERYLSDEDAPAPRKPWWIVVGAAVGLYVAYRWIVG